MELIHYAEPSESRIAAGGGGFLPATGAALNAPIHLAAATRTRRVISGVLYHSLRILQLPSVSRAQVAVGRSS